jgi:hypothetical protein
MLPYLLLTTAIALVAILFPQRRPDPLAWGLAFVVLVLFVGLRHKVGMDWNNYLIMARYVDGHTLVDSLSVAEPAYAILLWISVKLGLGVYGANLVGALIFFAGLFRFARTTPLPWVALTVAMPILVVVVAMSANRQTISIGILLWLIARWESTSLLGRVAHVLAAAAFHLSAIFFLMFAALGLDMRRSYRVILGLVMAVSTFAFLQLSGGAEYYDSLYVSGQSALVNSSGATQHVLLNGLPAAMIIAGKTMRERLFPNVLLRQMALLALALVPAAYLYSVASGRMTLYLFPVSMYALSALPGVLDGAALRALARTALCVCMCAVLVFWLSFANSRNAHIPYSNALLVDPSRWHL